MQCVSLLTVAGNVRVGANALLFAAESITASTGTLFALLY